MKDKTENRAKALLCFCAAGASLTIAGSLFARAQKDLRPRKRVPGGKRVPNLRVKK